MSRCEHMSMALPKWANHMRMLGEAATATVTAKLHPKLKDKGVTCMFVRCVYYHDGDCYCVWYEHTKDIL